MFGCRLLLGVLVAGFLAVPSFAQDLNEKARLLQALENLFTRLQQLQNKFRANQQFRSPLSMARDHVVWLRAETMRWRPERDTDARPLRKSIELMVSTLDQNVRGASASTLETFKEIQANLSEKTVLCRTLGLSAEAQVTVRTKKGGTVEVKGLEVWYLEKFLAVANPKAQPHRFRGFSSPVNDTFAAGKYVFWATNGGAGGPRAEQCICLRQPPSGKSIVFDIEILAP